MTSVYKQQSSSLYVHVVTSFTEGEGDSLDISVTPPTPSHSTEDNCVALATASRRGFSSLGDKVYSDCVELQQIVQIFHINQGQVESFTRHYAII